MTLPVRPVIRFIAGVAFRDSEPAREPEKPAAMSPMVRRALEKAEAGEGLHLRNRNRLP